MIDIEDQFPMKCTVSNVAGNYYFDLHDTILEHELAGKTMDVGDTSLSTVRVGQPVAGVTCVVLDTKNGSNSR